MINIDSIIRLGRKEQAANNYKFLPLSPILKYCDLGIFFNVRDFFNFHVSTHKF